MSGVEGGLLLALARALAVASLLSAFGAQVFAAWVLPRVGVRFGALTGLARGSLVAAAVLLPAWAVLQAAELVGAGWRFAALPDALLHTLFGRVLLVQLAAVLLALLVRRRWPALALSAAALLLQAGHSHAWSMEGGPSLLLVSDCVHLLAAGAWLGGLAPLLMVVRGASLRDAALAARWFSPLGKACVVGLVASAAYQFWALIGGLPGLVGTSYGWVAGAKLVLLGVLLGFAVVNRYRLAPALLRDAGAGRDLVRAIAVQTGFGLATVIAAGVLAQLPPSLHEQPVWPFAWRPSLVAMAEPDLADEVWLGVAWMMAAAVLPMALGWRRLRRPGPACALVASAAVLAWFSAPHLSLLLVEAYPTSYYASPSGFAARSIMAGMALYPQHCAGCHGAGGRGDGAAAPGLAVPPADLTAGHLWDHSDGEMFWWLSHGMAAPDGTVVMPGVAGTLSEDQRWALIDAIRARNAGLALREGGAWPAPVRLPGFSVACPGRDAMTVEDLQGAPLSLVVGPLAITITRGAISCAAVDPTARDALAVVTGAAAERLAGSRMIVDAAGWMRAFRPAGRAAEWDDPAVLAAAMQAAAAPLAVGGGHHHH